MSINNAADTLNAALTFNGNPITFTSSSAVSFLGGFGINNTTAISAVTSQSLSIAAGTTLSMTSTGAMTINSTAASITVQSTIGGFTLQCATLGLITSTSNISVICSNQLLLQSDFGAFSLIGVTASSISCIGNISITTTLATVSVSSADFNVASTTNISIGTPSVSLTFNQRSEAATLSSGGALTLQSTSNGFTLSGNTGSQLIESNTFTATVTNAVLWQSLTSYVAFNALTIQVEGGTFVIDTSNFEIIQALASASTASATGAFVPSVITQKFLVWDSADNLVKLYVGH